MSKTLPLVIEGNQHLLALDRVTRVGPHRARPEDSTLDLIKDDDGTNVPSALDDLGEPLDVGLPDTALALDGLKDDAARLVRNEFVDPLLVVHHPHTDRRQQRCERVLVLRVRRNAERAHRPPVEGALEADDLRLLVRSIRELLLRMLADKLEGPLVGLCSRVGEEDLGGR